MKEKYSIQGMNCASCANHIYEAVNKLEGVEKCEVSLLLNQMNIEKDESLSSDKIIAAVENAGYKALIYNPFEKKDKNELKHKKIELIICIICSIFSMLLSMMLFKIITVSKLSIVLQSITLFILSLIVFYIQKQRLVSGIKQLMNLTPTMDSLIALGSISSLVYSLINSYFNIFSFDLNNIRTLYFDSSIMILSFSAIGKYLENKAKIKTTSSITSLMNLMPSKAILYNQQKQIRINIEDIELNDLLLIKPGAKVPVDGIIVEGNSYLDNSVLSGESLPIEAHTNDSIKAGCLNLNGTIVIKATSTFKDSTFSKIIKLVDEASNSKAPISRLADIISKYFVFGVISISLLTFIIWMIISKDIKNSFNYAISVLVISCPCALGLATPTAIMASSGKAASMGFVYKNGAVLEKCADIDTLIFDKTNTITKGYLQVIEEVKYTDEPINYDALYTLENSNDHPIAKAILRHLENKNVNKIDGEIEYITSMGSVLKCNNDVYSIGNEKLMQKFNIKILKQIDEGYSIVYFAKNEHLLCAYYLGDDLKDDIKQVLAKLANYRKIMLTGDSEIISKKISNEVMIDEYYASLLPQDKQKIIKDLQKKKHKVAMIGDGINDSIALTSADIGIAVNNATDIAISAADVVVMSDNMSSIVNILSLAKFSLKIIKENLLWALGYNVVLIPIAAGALSSLNITINPMISSLAMSLSSLTVVSNALRINTYKPFKADLNNNINQKTYILEIDHMMCEHCQKAVENALLDINIISTTNLDNSTCTIITNKKLDFDLINNVINKAGYKITNVILK